jgi:hypothetical protein
MRAAINAYHAEHTLNVVPKVTMPQRRKADSVGSREMTPLACSAQQWGFVWDVAHGRWRRNQQHPRIRQPARGNEMR